MTKELGKKPANLVPIEPEILEDQIRARAYELYEERGKEDGHDLDDWLRAEADLTEPKGRPKAKPKEARKIVPKFDIKASTVW